MKKIITVPDIHGDIRAVYRAVQKINDCDVMVFMGDYMDSDHHSRGEQVTTLEYLIDLKHKYRNIVLLLGNHDFKYAHNTSSYQKHMAYTPTPITDYIRELFTKNRHLFQLGYCIDVSIGRWWVFTHAGLNAKFIQRYAAIDSVYSKKWIDALNKGWWFGRISESYGKEIIEPNPGTRFDIIEEHIVRKAYVNAVSDIHPLRGGSANHGGILWADKREMVAAKSFCPNTSQFMAHTCTYSGKAMYRLNGKSVEIEKHPFTYEGQFHFFCGETHNNEHILR